MAGPFTVGNADVDTEPYELGNEDPTREMAAVNGAPPDSMLGQLRAASARQRAARSTLIAVGGEFGEQLRVRYGVLSVADMERYAGLVQGSNLSNVGIVIDMLVACCQGLEFTPTGGDSVVLEDDRGPVRLDDRLAVLMGWPHPLEAPLKPREVVEALFGGNAMLIDRHATALVDWMRSDSEGDPAPGEA